MDGYTCEEEAKEGLDTCGYGGKWKSAKDYVSRHQPDLSTHHYWSAVRLHFLEIGGEWIEYGRKDSGIPRQANTLPVIPQTPFEPFRKIRFA